MRNLIVFPRRGDPPPDQPPYERDPGDPFVFNLPWAECRHRIRKACCGGGGTEWCHLIDEPIDRVRCWGCRLPEKGP